MAEQEVHTQKIDSLQVMRAVGMPFILLAHTALVMVYTGVSTPGVGLQIVGFLLTIGEGMLDLFFVGSGFTMVYISARTFGQKGAGWSFLFRRITRVVPAYWFYMTLAICLSVLLPSPMLQEVTPERIVKSFLFIPYNWHDHFMVSAQPWPILIPGWTLNFEALYYVSFSLFLFLNIRTALIAFTAFIFVLLGIHQFVPQEMAMPYFWTSPQLLKFLTGCWIGYAYHKGCFANLKTWLSLLLITIGVLGIGTTYFFLANDYKDQVFFHAIITAFAGLVIFCVVLTPIAKRDYPAWLVNLGDAAYSIYLCQLVILIALFLPLYMFFDTPLWVRWPLGVAGYLASIACGVASYRFYEMPASRYLRRMMKFKPIYS